MVFNLKVREKRTKMSNDVKPVSFQTKNQIRLFIGERSKVAFDSGCKMFDVYLMDTYQVNNKIN